MTRLGAENGRLRRKAMKSPNDLAKSLHPKIEKVMHEGKMGKLHSGSKHGPVVAHGSKQEVAIALSEARKAGEKVSPKK